MTKRMMLPALLCAVAAGCGSNGGNAAASKTFTYPSSPSSTTAGTGASDAVSSALTFKSGTSAESGMSAQAALFSAAADTLGDDGIALAPTSKISGLIRSARAQALTTVSGSSTFSPADCYTATATSVTFKGCKLTETSDGSNVEITLDGSVSLSGSTLSWSYTMVLDLSSTSAKVAATYRDAGDFTLTDTTAKAHDAADISVSATAGGQSATYGMAQAADLDVTYAAADVCATRITGGTFEAKRVWTQKPSGASGSVFADKGVKIEWQGCGSANVFLSVS